MGFSRQEYWRGLSFLLQGIFPTQGSNLGRDPKYSKLNKMKMQKNIQQVKEHDKNPSNQTKEEEIGSLPEKEFGIMIIKMIQNLENSNGVVDK